MSPELHPWEAATDEVGDWLNRMPDQLVQAVVGDHRPWQPPMSHEDQMAYHLEHLYPPQLGGAFDPQYLAHVEATGTREEVKALAQSLDRHVLSKAEQIPPNRVAPYRPPTAPPPRPPRRY